MKIIGSLFGLLLSLSAFTASYSGAGSWKSSSGDSGNYSAQVTVESGDLSTVISQTLRFNDEVLNFSVVLQRVDDNFYNVLNEQNEIVGDGYCWALENDEKICHTTTHEHGFLVESTIKKTANAIYRVGSKTNLENQEKIIWVDALSLQSNE